MGKNRLELRRMAEAAETRKKASGAEPEKQKTATKRKAKRKTAAPRKAKDKALQRKRIVWCVYNGSMKEEGRFPYDQKEAAEAKLELLRSKSKKMYFIQPVKEVIGDAVSIPVPVDEDIEEELLETDADAEASDEADGEDAETDEIDDGDVEEADEEEELEEADDEE